MKLRDYELKAVRELPRLLRKHRRVVAVAPTGSGKTVIAAALVRAMRGKRALWLAHRIELLKQALEQLIAAGVPASSLGLLAGIGSVELRDGTRIGQNENASIIVASVDMFRGGREVPRCELIVVDEAHRTMAATYRGILDQRPRAQVLGLTATPWRLDGEPLGDVFEHLHVMAESVELIADKFIAAPRVYGVPREKARAIVKGLKSGNGDYVGKDAERSAMRYLMGDVVSECSRLAPGARTLVFATTRKHGRALTKRFKRSGRRAEYLDGDTPANERAAMLARLESGETEVIINVDVLAEGFDCPPVKCIALARPTRSLTRFLQQCGRASRPFGNKRPVILDHAGNCYRFGLPQSPREWSLTDESKASGGGDPVVKQCPECEEMIPAACKICPECGAEQPMPEREIEEQRAKLEELAALKTEMEAARERVAAVARERGAGAKWRNEVMRAIFGEVTVAP
jgi:DNA repair protein RadD